MGETLSAFVRIGSRDCFTPSMALETLGLCSSLDGLLGLTEQMALVKKSALVVEPIMSCFLVYTTKAVSIKMLC